MFALAITIRLTLAVRVVGLGSQSLLGLGQRLGVEVSLGVGSY